MRYKAALFDLDGVVVDTEPQYNQFWGSEFKRYYPEDPSGVAAMKGQTLTHIFGRWFSGPLEAERPAITARLNDFERKMQYPYVPGFEAFIDSLRAEGLKTALVTSSSPEKMQNVYRNHPSFGSHFDLILTAQDVTRSKPAPDCYLLAASRLNVQPQDCLVFEDSFNGLRSGMAAGMKVVGLTTSNPAEAIASLSHLQIPHFLALPEGWMERL